MIQLPSTSTSPSPSRRRSASAHFEPGEEPDTKKAPAEPAAIASALQPTITEGISFKIEERTLKVACLCIVIFLFKSLRNFFQMRVKVKAHPSPKAEWYLDGSKGLFPEMYSSLEAVIEDNAFLVSFSIDCGLVRTGTYRFDHSFSSMAQLSDLERCW